MEKLFLGISGCVVCLDKKTGQELWKTKLKRSEITNVYYESDFIYAYSGGHLFCLNASAGEIQWENQLNGLGYGSCIIASEHQSSTVISSQIATQQTSAAAGAAVVAAAAGASS